MTTGALAAELGMPGGALGVRACAGRDVLLAVAGFCFLRSSISKQ
jgi:hypothetical protein